MRREDLTEMLDRIPEVDHPKVQLIMRAGPMLSVDTVIRLEPTYLVMRGREGGQTDDERGFFVPYDEILYIKLERAMKLAEMVGMYAAQAPTVPQTTPAGGVSDTATPPPLANLPPAQTPAEIARTNLLERLRAAKSMGTAAGKP